jgi:hypothetical protein
MTTMQANQFIDATNADLRDRMTILEARLEKGFTYTGDAADRKWIGLLREYEAACDELRRRGQALV